MMRTRLGSRWTIGMAVALLGWLGTSLGAGTSLLARGGTPAPRVPGVLTTKPTISVVTPLWAAHPAPGAARASGAEPADRRRRSPQERRLSHVPPARPADDARERDPADRLHRLPRRRRQCDAGRECGGGIRAVQRREEARARRTASRHLEDVRQSDPFVHQGPRRVARFHPLREPGRSARHRPDVRAVPHERGHGASGRA